MRATAFSVTARVVLLAAVASLGACKTYDSLTQRIARSITPYRITVVQGNFVSAEAASRLRVGMSRDEVRSVLGTPLLTDLFHADRWDYVFYFKRGSTSIVQQRDLVVNFVGDRVASWIGADDLPSEYELIAEIDGDRKGLKKAEAEAAAAKAAKAAAADASAAAASAPVAQAPVPGTAAASGVSDVSVLPSSQAANEEAAAAANRVTAQVAPQHIALPPTGVAPSPDPSTGLAPPSAAGLQNQPVLERSGAQGTRQ
ncbi:MULTISPECIES: outer membrane protein assembly factor BamE [Mycetohabitans]|uniref:Outer membrane protein assembly factor BamE n=1 Tax=Mycetohabitans endofungorum TaxID=417203 RepID=A0A2P5K9L6_9BURK|nr:MULTISPECIES: outer membrane protein assembly factor BamE [Mycetohabitans]PPB83417.1 Beta-barrel assembly machine subunit BamE [Mycetohabitans endofungorum]